MLNIIKKYSLSIIIFTLSFTLYISNVYALEENDDSPPLDITEASQIVDDILEEKEITEANDINKDDKLDINDVTTSIYNDNKEIYDEEQESNDNLSILINNPPKNTNLNNELDIDLSINGFINDKINGIEGNIQYTADKLELVTINDSNNDILYGSFNEKGKFVYILNNYNKLDPILSFKFKTISPGNSSIIFRDIILSYNGIEKLKENKNINIIIAKQKESNNIKPNNTIYINNDYLVKKINDYNKPVYAISDTGKKISISYINISNDNTIKSLIIKDYKIDFNKDILEYNIIVNGKTNKLDMIIELNDKNATYEVIGNKKFKTGDNKVYIVVTALDGSIKKYIINVKKEKIKENNNSNSSKIVIIGLLILIIIGLLYVVFKEEDDDY
ncbi:MAG: hypothetical protein VZS44_07170 [Bacilli bacterium]|nr:hypothetical protein [Bacilli bacterium]